MDQETFAEDGALKPPSTIDGAKVLWWAWSGEQPFGEILGPDEMDLRVFGIAVCQYESGEIYRFGCDKHWECIADVDADSVEEARDSIPTNYDTSRILWRPYPGRQRDTLSDDSD